MANIVFLIEQTAIGLYILLGVGVVWQLRQWMNARQDYKATSFELERDLARYKSGNALTLMVLLIEAGLIVFGVHNIVAPTLRDDMNILQASVVEVEDIDSRFVTPTRPASSGGVVFDPSGVDFGSEQNLQVFSTAVLTATPVGTIEPNAPAPAGCDTPNATLQIPANGMRVFQPISVAGTAFIDNFSSYKLEIGRPGGQFTVVDAGTNSVP